MVRIASWFSLAVVLAGAVVARAEDWPQYRGPRGDGISQEKITDQFPAEGPKKIWTTHVGAGFSSPIAVKGVVYIFMNDADKETLYAIDPASGAVKWKQSYEPVGLNEGGYKGTRATPAFEEGKIYTLGGGGQATCWDAADSGKILWQTNVLKETGSGNLQWGTASSPLLLGERIYVQVGASGPLAVGLNKKTGKIEWRTEAKGPSGYAAPIAIDVAGTKQLVVMGGREAFGVALDGKTIWHEKWAPSYDVNATSPLYRDGHLWISSGYGHGSMMLDVTATGAKKVWETKDLSSKFPGIILDGEYVFGNSEGKLKGLHWPDGKVLWQAEAKLNEGGSLVRSGDKLLALSERGKLFLFKTDGPSQEKLAEAQIVDASNVWSTPLIYGGKLYVKAGEDLMCFDIAP